MNRFDGSQNAPAEAYLGLLVSDRGELRRPIGRLLISIGDPQHHGFVKRSADNLKSDRQSI